MTISLKIKKWMLAHIEFLVPCLSSIDKLVAQSKSSAAGYVAETPTGCVIAYEMSNQLAEKRATQVMALVADTDAELEELVLGMVQWFSNRKGSMFMYYSAPFKSSVDEVLLNNGFTLEGSMLIRRRYGIL